MKKLQTASLQKYKKILFPFLFSFFLGVFSFASLTYAETIQEFIANLASKNLGLHIQGNAAFEKDVYVGENVGIGTANPTEKLTVDGVIETSGGIKFADGTTLNSAAVSSSSSAPTGVINQFAGSVSPDGWLIADGSAVSRTIYADLYYVIGETYGSGDGTTTFNLPNLKGRIPVGIDLGDTSFDTMGFTGGEKTHLLTADESGIQAHTHMIEQKDWVSTNPGNYYLYDSSNDLNITYRNNNRGTLVWNSLSNHRTKNATPQDALLAHNNLQPYIVLNYIIKY